jgi:hypothetical protein
MTNALRFLQPLFALAGPMTMANTVLGYLALAGALLSAGGMIVAGIQAKYRQDHGAMLSALQFAGWMAFSTGIVTALWAAAGWNFGFSQTIPTN